jgi:hypothetical protein
MDKVEAKLLLDGELLPYRNRPYAELAQQVGSLSSYQKTAASGVEYNIEIEVVWDSLKERRNIRVTGAVDDGRGLTSLMPLSSDFIVAPDGTFVGE